VKFDTVTVLKKILKTRTNIVGYIAILRLINDAFKLQIRFKVPNLCQKTPWDRLLAIKFIADRF
jgi:hypothetical protein